MTHAVIINNLRRVKKKREQIVCSAQKGLGQSQIEFPTHAGLGLDVYTYTYRLFRGGDSLRTQCTQTFCRVPAYVVVPPPPLSFGMCGNRVRANGINRRTPSGRRRDPDAVAHRRAVVVMSISCAGCLYFYLCSSHTRTLRFSR